MRFRLPSLAAVALLLPAGTAGGQEGVTPAPVRAVHLSGRLGQRHRANVAYLLHLHRSHGEAMIAAFSERGRRKADRPWDGEYAGKWLDAAALTAANTGNKELTERVHQLADALRKAQADDGYMGIQGPETRGRTPWDVWNHWYAITGWLTHHETFGDAASLAAARRAGRWLTDHYGPIDPAHTRFFRGAWGGGCNVDVLDQMVRLHRLTGEETFRRFAAATVAHYPPIRSMRSTRRPPLTHAYVLAAYLGGTVELARTTGRADDLAWVEAVWERMYDDHLYPTGSLGLGETLRPPPPAEKPGAKMQETCATVEWLILTHRLYRATGRVRYAHAIERTACNALLAAQSADGMKWMYYTPLRYEKQWFSGPTRCCYWSGPRGIARLPTLVYATDEEGLRVDLLASSRAALPVLGREVRVDQKSACPAAGRTAITVRPPEPMRFALKVRIPPHVRDPKVTVNDEPAGGTVEAGTYARLLRSWRPGDRVQVTFGMASRRVPLGDGVLIQRGPEFLAADARDNPDMDLEAVAAPADLALEAADASGNRRRYAARMRVAGRPRRVLLTPWADAGHNGARFTAVFRAD